MSHPPPSKHTQPLKTLLNLSWWKPIFTIRFTGAFRCFWIDGAAGRLRCCCARRRFSPARAGRLGSGLGCQTTFLHSREGPSAHADLQRRAEVAFSAHGQQTQVMQTLTGKKSLPTDQQIAMSYIHSCELSHEATI